jgi:DNA-binding NtrC family response regulator
MSAHGLRVLVIDDEKNIRSTLTLCLEQIHCEVTAVASAQAALEALAQQPHDLAFLDLHLGQSNGLELIPQLLGQAPDLMIVIMTAYATVDRAVKAIQSGAADYLPKPFTPAQIRHIVAKASRKKPQRLSAAAEAALVAYGWPGNIRELRNTIERAVILWPAEIIEPEAFPAHICVRSKAPSPGDWRQLLSRRIEREHILQVLARSATLDRAAEILGIDASTRRRKRKKYES